MGYEPIYISGNSTGLVQSRQEFILPNDAYPVLENAFIFREQIRRKQGSNPLGRLQRSLTTASFGNITAGGAGTLVFNIISGLITATSITATETNAEIAPGNLNNITIAIGAPILQTLTDTTGTGALTITGAGPITTASLSYSSGNLSLTFSGAAGASGATFTGSYYPGLPVMGERDQETQDTTFDKTIFFDTVYAYSYNGGTSQFQEFVSGTIWTGSDSQFFWSTNYWVSSANTKIFWATNDKDPIRYTNGTAWANFTPPLSSIMAPDLLLQALCLLPFRGRLVAFNTVEGIANPGKSYSNRIRWAAIGTPFYQDDGVIITTGINAQAWFDNVRGQGGFLDIPTNEDIIAVGFVRDNLVIYCERSTWQLRYTGRTIAPFQIEKVNSELGVESTFSSVQFDTSLVGIGDKGIVECDSFKSERIDIKIPDLVFGFQNGNNGTKRVHGIRDFTSRLAYWTYPSSQANGTYPDKRLIYNYENDSWAIFNDSFTCFGTFQNTVGRTWLQTPIPWEECNFNWLNKPEGDFIIVAGNQQGFVMQIGDQLFGTTTNGYSLSIANITAHTTTSTEILSPNHNLQTGAIIEISGIISATPFANLNGGIFYVVVKDANSFYLNIYNSSAQAFDLPQVDPVPATPYIGCGKISIRDNFNITSKKFNFAEQGQSIQFGYLDVLMNSTKTGAISLNIYQDYDTTEPVNTLDQNAIDGTDPEVPDTFFNSIIDTSQSSISGVSGSKYWQRVFCPTRANFITLQYTLSNAQMAGDEQKEDVQIDAQVLWVRPAGRMTQP